MKVRRSNERGFADHGWLKSYHSFSFASFYDPNFMGFGPLRVINDDKIAANSGFGTHPHQDMEIITYVVEGEVTHKDTLGSHGIIKPGEIQVMSAGKGIQHSEHNLHSESLLHLLQIWVIPRTRGLPPRYQQVSFDTQLAQKNWVKLVSAEGQGGLVDIDQDLVLATTKMNQGDKRSLNTENSKGRFWLQLVTGEIQIGDFLLKTGDALYGQNIDLKDQIESKVDGTHILWFDMA